MNPAQLLSHFDRISEAPEAIPRLRRFILELAVRGKLVEQDPRDERASELLERIQRQNGAFHGRQSKHADQLRTVHGGGWPFCVPDTWAWIELGSIADKLTDGSHNPPSDAGNGFPMLSSQNVLEGTIRFDNPTRYLSRPDFEVEDRRTRITGGDILLTIVGSIGRSAVVPEDAPKFALQRSVAVIRTQLLPEFLSLQLRSPTVQMYLDEHGKGTAQRGIYLGKLAGCPIAVPPLAEQHRIVAKVDELMALCDRLEAAQTERESRRDRLAAASLHHLNNGWNADEFREHIRFYFSHLPCLTKRPEHVQQLRQTILNLAVRGKLVTQDENDERAIILLQKINKELCSTIGKISLALLKRDDSISDPTEYHHEIPDTWEWCELQQISVFVNGKPHEQLITNKPGYILVNSRFVSNSGGIVKYAREQLLPLIEGDIAIVMSDVPNGRALARCFIVDANKKYTLNQRIGCIRTSSLLCKKYLAMVLDRNTYLLSYDDGKKQTNLKKIQIVSCPVPLPPLAEQKRIVAKVNELMALCDRLETQLTATQTEGRRLLEAVLHEALAS
jgi:type I restriction enzyme, S subunit